MVEFLLNSGFRKENVLDLKIEDVRILCSEPIEDHIGLADLRVKGERYETYVLSPAALTVFMRAAGNRKSGHVFVNPATGQRWKDIKHSFNKAVGKLGLTVKVGMERKKLTIHDLRHQYGNWLEEAGVSRDSIRILWNRKADFA